MDKALWKRLQNLRQAYLKADGYLADYWQDEQLLDAYDKSLGQRIQWKWDAVLETLPPRKIDRLVDWGCGSGGATRAVLRHWECSEVLLLDRSAKARAFAAKKVREEHPKVRVVTEMDDKPFALLVSHVLSELPEGEVEKVLDLARRAQVVLWVEAGRRQESRKLSAIREKLRPLQRVLAPCPHSSLCGMLREGQEENWCHFMAKAPSAVYQSAFWRDCSKELGFDLRSLPVSYLYTEADAESSAGSDMRVLAGSRQYKGYTRFSACMEQGIMQSDFMKRTDKKLYERLADPGLDLLLPESLLTKKDETDDL